MKLALNPLKENSFILFIKKEIVLCISLVLAIGSCCLSLPKLEYIDFKVLILLFNLMIVVAAFNKLKVLDYLATNLLTRCTSLRSITFTLIFLCFFSSMIVTNDVSLLTFVPLTIIICKKANINPINIIVFQTLASNLGSSLTPMGNPQNLFIHSYFNIDTIEFFRITLPLILISMFFLILINIKSSKEKLSLDLHKVKLENKKQIFLFLLLFVVILLSVFKVINYNLVFLITILTVLILDKELFKDVDYSLLFTFIFFFIFIGNISSLDSVKQYMASALSSKNNTFFSSILLSQVISNVPCTMLLAPFTEHYKELLLGVNIGGLGTIIASMASLISYKLYAKELDSNSSKYMKVFTIYNVSLLAIFTLIFFYLKI